jgi:hypothetical protein
LDVVLLLEHFPITLNRNIVMNVPGLDPGISRDHRRLVASGIDVNARDNGALRPSARAMGAMRGTPMWAPVLNRVPYHVPKGQPSRAVKWLDDSL